MPVRRQQRWADIDATLAALAASVSDRNSEVLSQCGYRGANVGPALTTLTSIRECDNSVDGPTPTALVSHRVTITTDVTVCCHSPHVIAGGDNQHNCHPPRGLSW